MLSNTQPQPPQPPLVFPPLDSKGRYVQSATVRHRINSLPPQPLEFPPSHWLKPEDNEQPVATQPQLAGSEFSAGFTFKMPNMAARIVGDMQEGMMEPCQVVHKYIDEIYEICRNNLNLSTTPEAKVVVVDLDVPASAETFVHNDEGGISEHIYALLGDDLLDDNHKRRKKFAKRHRATIGSMLRFKEGYFHNFLEKMSQLREQIAIALQQRFDIDYGTNSNSRREVFIMGDKLGEGGTAEVYSLYQHSTTNNGTRLVAKMPINARANPFDPQVGARLKRATKFCPNLAGYYDTVGNMAVDVFGNRGRRVDLVENLGADVTCLCDVWEGELDNDNLYPALVGSLNGLCALHKEGLVLGPDLGPDNIFLHPNGEWVFADYETVRLDGDDSRVYGGLPELISPERFKGHPLTTKDDIFAFGAMLWMEICLTDAEKDHIGQLQPRGRISLAQQRINNGFDLSRIPDGHYLKDIIIACLQEDPDDRPTAEELLDFMEGVNNGTEPNIQAVAA